MAKKVVQGECGESHGKGIEVDASLLNLLKAVGVEAGMLPDEARKAGYRPVDEFAEASRLSVTRAREYLADAVTRGLVERARVGKSNWFRAK